MAKTKDSGKDESFLISGLFKVPQKTAERIDDEVEVEPVSARQCVSEFAKISQLATGSLSKERGMIDLASRSATTFYNLSAPP